MTSSFSASVYAKTPNVTVVDNRGLTVRELAWRRTAADSLTELLITRHHYSAGGHLTESMDPRLGAARQHDPSVKANFTWRHDLTGNALHTDSVDAGTSLSLHDIEGRPLREVSGNSVTRRYGYEASTLPGRLLYVAEQLPGEEEQILERLIWADPTEQDANLVGTAKWHYDTAGLGETKAISLTSAALYSTRRLLTDGTDPDWSGDSQSAWQATLGPETYAVQSVHDATGNLIIQTDAGGHAQRLAYDIAGQLKHSHLTLQGGQERTVVRALDYSAAGQKLREEHGNGVVTEYCYEPETQRLLSIRTVRPEGGKETVLQDLRYTYDPVGNVLNVRNDAEKKSFFWRNQKVEPKNTYTYDSLYQLVKATGRELANIGKQSITLPKAQVPLPDDTVYAAYTRSYTYDTSGNLTRIRHDAPASSSSPYALGITVSSRSNRAVMQDLTDNPDEVEALFDAAGNQRYLQKGQPLTWNGRNELRQVIQIQRETEQNSDREWYRYGSGSSRVLKVSEVGNRQQRVVYLPGLEQRTTLTNGKVSEDLQVITVGEAGRAQVRVLHWQSGKPDGVANDQLRYSYDNLIGSSQLELGPAGAIINKEEYYPYGGTAVWAARSTVEADYKTIRYSGKERDATGLYYYGYRYYQPWVARWLKPDPTGTVDGLNVYRMVRGNPVTMNDRDGSVSSFESISRRVVYGYSQARPALMSQAIEEGVHFMTIDEFNECIGLPQTITLEKYFEIKTQLSRGAGAPFDEHKIKTHASRYRDAAENKKLVIDELDNIAISQQRSDTNEWWEYMAKNNNKLDVQKKLIKRIEKDQKSSWFKKNHALHSFILKNSEPENSITGEEQKKLLVKFAHASDTASLSKEMTDKEKKWIEDIVTKTFFRQTSQLGMDWFIDMGINDFVFANKDYYGSPLNMADVQAKPWIKKERRRGESSEVAEPITYSEIRHANKRGYFKSGKIKWV